MYWSLNNLNHFNHKSMEISRNCTN